MKTNKISIIGTGNVGAATAYTLMLQKVASDIVLVDVNKQRAIGEAMDIYHGTSLVAPVEVVAGEIADTKGSDIVIIAAGIGQKPGETRLDLVNKNVALYKELIPQIVKYNPQAILLVVSNPVDILTQIAYEVSGLPKSKVIGSGTVLDTSRLRSSLAREFNVDARNVHAYVLGEHGDSEVVCWSRLLIGGLTFDEYYCQEKIKENKQKFQERLTNETKHAAYEIINKKGYTNYAIAVAVSRICTAILRDERSIMTVSCQLNGEYGIKDTYLSTTALVGRNGILDVYELPVSASELKALQDSGKILADIFRQSNL